MNFTKSELEMLYQYAAPTKEETLAGLKEIVPVLERKDDLLSKVIVWNTIRKLEKLAEPECSQFIADNRAAKNPPDLAHARIYDRILERCAPVLFSGKNFREEGARATKAAAKEIVRKDNKV